MEFYRMKMHRISLEWGLIAFVLCALPVGCSDDAGRTAQPRAVSAANETARVRLEREIDALKMDMAQGSFPETEYFSRLDEELRKMPQEERTAVFRHMRNAFASPSLSTRNLSRRGMQLEGYLSTVRSLAFAFDGMTDDREGVWDFLLGTLESAARERRVVGGRDFEADVPPMGIYVPTDMYLSRLDRWLFHAVRRGFERGPFAKYYGSLDSERRREWIERLERTAGRKVVIPAP